MDHLGDFAYDMFRDNASLGDAWFNFVEPIYANIPVMTCAGNHEGLRYIFCLSPTFILRLTFLGFFLNS